MLDLPRSSALPALGLVGLLAVAEPVFAQAASSTEAQQPAGPALLGQVHDDQGRPVADATVRVLQHGLSAHERDRQISRWVAPWVAITDAEGRFSFAQLTGAEFTVRIEASGNAPQTVQAIPRGASLNIQLELGRELAGRVLGSADDRPLSQARVVVCDEGALPFGRLACPSVQTDEDGTFSIAHVPEGELRLRAVASAHAASSVSRIGPTDEVGDLEFQLGRGADLRGRIVDQNDRAVPGARVTARARGSNVWEAARENDAWPVFSDDEGGFLLEGLAAGADHELAAYRSDRPGAVAGPFAVRAGHDLQGIEIRMPAAARLVVRLIDPDGAGVEQAEFFLEPADGDSTEDRSLWSRPIDPGLVEPRGEGRYEVQKLESGTFELRIVPAELAETTRSNVILRPTEATDLGTIVLDRGREINGRVTDPDGVPIRGAKVQATYGNPLRPTSRSAETDTDGRYVVGGLRDKPVTLWAEADGFFVRKHDVPAGETTVDLVLDPAGGVSGVVRLDSGDPPQGFSILVHREAEGAAETSESSVGVAKQQPFTSEDGAFRVSDLAPGRYTVEARASGWAPGRKSGVDVSAREVTDVGTLTLPQGLKMRGTVVTRGEQAPVSGATVRAEGRRGWLFKGDEGWGNRATTDERGAFELPGLEPGSYTVKALHPEYAPAEVEIRLEEGVRPADAVLELSAGGTLVGTVWDQYGQPVSDRTIYLGQDLLDDDARHVTTGPDGRYRFGGLPPGSYEARLLPRPGPAFSVATKTVVIRENEVTVQDFRDESRIRLSGTVLRGNRPVTQAQLLFTDARTGMNLSDFQIARTDPDGRYEVHLERPGTYRVTVHGDNAGTSAVEVVVPDEEQVTQDIILDLEGISGAVLDTEGHPLAQAVVSATRDGGSASALRGLLVAETDPDGRYSIQGLEPGNYRVTAVATGFQVGVIYPVEVTGDAQVSGLDFQLEPGRSLRGRVIDGQGRGIAGAYVFAAPAGIVDTLSFAGAETDVNGAFEMTTPTDGRIDVTAFAAGWAPVRLQGAVPPEEWDETGIVLQAGSGGDLRVRVLGPEAVPRQGVHVEVRAVPAFLGSEFVQVFQPPPPTDADGRTLIRHLAPGTYDVGLLGRPDLPPIRTVVHEATETTATLNVP